MADAFDERFSQHIDALGGAGDIPPQDEFDRALSALSEPERDTSLAGAIKRREESGLVTVPGTDVQILPEAAALGRIALETAGDVGAFALTKKLPIATGTRLLKAGKAGFEALATGAGAGAGSLAAEVIDPTEGDALSRAEVTAGITSLSDLMFNAIGGTVVRRFTGPGAAEPGALAVIERFGTKAKDIGKLKRFDRGGPIATGGRLGTSLSADIVETMAEAGLFGSGAIRRRLLRSGEAGQQELDKLTNKLLKGASRVDVSNYFKSLVSESVVLYKAQGKEMYRALDESIAAEGNVFKVDLKGLFAARDRWKAKIDPEAPGIKRVVGMIEDALKKANPEPPDSLILLADGTKRPTRSRSTLVPFEIAQELRSAFLKAGQSADPILRGGSAAGSDLAGVLDRQIDVAGLQLDGKSLALFRDAGDFWKNGRDTLQNQSLLSILRSPNADTVIDVLIKPNGTASLREIREVAFGSLGENINVTSSKAVIAKARKVLSSPTSTDEAKRIAAQRLRDGRRGREIWRNVQGQVLADITRKSDPNSGIANKELFDTGTSLSARKFKSGLARISNETLTVLFPDKKVRRNVDLFLRQVEFSQASAGQNVPGKIFVQLAQAGAAATLAGFGAYVFTLGYTGTGAAGVGFAVMIVAGPPVIARVMDSERAIRWLIVGTSQRTSVAHKRRAWNQLHTILIAEGARAFDSEGNEITSSRVEHLQGGPTRLSIEERQRFDRGR